MSPIRSLTVLIFNDSPARLELLQRCFEAHGHRAVTVQLSLSRAAYDVPKQMLDEHRPHVAVFDVGVPYQSSWDFLQTIRVSHLFNGTPVVVTTAHKAALDRVIGPNDALEVMGQREDLDAILVAAEAAARQSQSDDDRSQPKS